MPTARNGDSFQISDRIAALDPLPKTRSPRSWRYATARTAQAQNIPPHAVKTRRQAAASARVDKHALTCAPTRSHTPSRSPALAHMHTRTYTLTQSHTQTPTHRAPPPAQTPARRHTSNPTLDHSRTRALAHSTLDNVRTHITAPARAPQIMHPPTLTHAHPCTPTHTCARVSNHSAVLYLRTHTLKLPIHHVLHHAVQRRIDACGAKSTHSNIELVAQARRRCGDRCDAELVARPRLWTEPLLFATQGHEPDQRRARRHSTRRGRVRWRRGRAQACARARARAWHRSRASHAHARACVCGGAGAGASTRARVCVAAQVLRKHRCAHARR